MSFRIILLGLALLAGCDGEFCKRRMEIVPGMVWESLPSHRSVVDLRKP